MKFCRDMQTFIAVALALFFFLGASEARPYPIDDDVQPVVSRTITVDKHGRGDVFASVQQAIDSIPTNNNAWTRIYIKFGIYVEKVEIPQDKPYIILEGDPNHLPVIEYGSNGGDVTKSHAFELRADNFIARSLVFKNTWNRFPLPKPNHGRPMTQAPAAAIYGDKASFYRCRFLSVQDTLADMQGRHYFYDCYIEGLVDFIWGSGQSIYEKCQINSLGRGSITAQGRDGDKNPTGFVFKDCYVSGSGRTTLLGRAYRPYSRVLFLRTYMEDIITPEGWTAPWNNGRNELTAFSEVDCKGPGADLSNRVAWEKKLSAQDVSYFSNAASFINQDGWMEKQPKQSLVEQNCKQKVM